MSLKQDSGVHVCCVMLVESKPVPAPRRLPELHDVPYDTPPSSNSEQFIEEQEAIYENTNSKKSTESGNENRVRTYPAKPVIY